MDVQNAQRLKETGCCPIFNPASWDEQEHQWDEKLFLKRTVRSIFHLPINFGSVITEAHKTLKDADAIGESPILLSDEKSMWSSDLLLEATKELPEEKMIRLSGTFLSKVFEGPYKNMSKWIGEMEQYVSAQGKENKKMYFTYTTCPKCAKAYGKNYVIIFVKVA